MEKLLFHYTTLNALDKILSCPNLNIRLTHSAYTNDKKEGLFFYQILHKWVEKYEDVKSILPDESVIPVIENFFSPQSDEERYGIFCLTPEGNNLTMWRLYGNDGKGVSIGFDFEKILDYLNNQPRNEMLSSYPIIQSENTLDWSITQCEYMTDKLDMNNDYFIRIYQKLYRIKTKGESDFSILGMMMMPNVAKHWGFEVENEYRIFKNKNLNFRKEGDKLYDYIHIPLKFLSCIYIGPCNIDNGSIDEIKQKLLELTGDNSIEVIQSELPYRN